MTGLAIDFASDSEQIVVGVIVAVIVGLLGALLASIRRMFKRVNDQDLALALLRQGQADIKATLDIQFGGNGGGMREALNQLKEDRKSDRERMDEHLTLHARH